jgi:hypothetical protein
MTKANFWEWFDNNKNSIENFILAEHTDYTVYEALSDKLKQYSEFLIPELTMTEDNKFVLVISCDGMKQGIPFANNLVEDIRPIDNWTVLSFRQPGPMEYIPVNGLNFKRTNIFLQWQKLSSQKYFLTFYVKGFSPQDVNCEIGTLLHMDHTIGEYNAMTRIEGVKIKKLGLFHSKKKLKTLDELKIELDDNSPRIGFASMLADE